MSIGNALAAIWLAIRNHLKKIFFAIFAFAFFLVVLFPFDDLSNYVSQRIAQATNQQIFLQFEHLGINVLPIALKLESVTLDTPFLPTIKSGSLTLSPFLLKRGLSFSAEDLLKGEISGSIGVEGEEGKELVEFSALYEDLDLQEVAKFLETDWGVSGRLNLRLNDGFVDMSMKEQPKVEFRIGGAKISLPDTIPPSIAVIGGLIVPKINLSEVNISGRLINRELIIEEGFLGTEKDPFRGKIRGKVDISFIQPMRGQFVPQIGAYELNLYLEMDSAFENDLKRKVPILYDPLSKLRSNTGRGGRYAIRIRAPNTYSYPEIGQGQAF